MDIEKKVNCSPKIFLTGSNVDRLNGLKFDKTTKQIEQQLRPEPKPNTNLRCIL